MPNYKPYKFDPIKELGLNISKDNREEALSAAADYLKESMLSYIGEGKSPVSGGKWVRGLTKDYKKKKSEVSSVTFANLEEFGDFLDSLTVEAGSKNILIEVGSDQEGKAEGFLTGLYGANAKNERPREFMPTGEKTFKREILAGLRNILEDYEDGV